MISSVTTGVHFGGIMKFPVLILKYNFMSSLALYGEKYMKMYLELLPNYPLAMIYPWYYFIFISQSVLNSELEIGLFCPRDVYLNKTCVLLKGKKSKNWLGKQAMPPAKTAWSQPAVPAVMSC